jgi:penicillin G amidase
MPGLFNPDGGLIVTANNPVVRPGSMPEMGETGNKGLRAARILSLLESRAALDAEAMRSIQLDTFDATAAVVIPYLLEVEPGEAGARRLQGSPARVGGR